MLKDGGFYSDMVHNHCILLVKCSRPGAFQTFYEGIEKLDAVLPSAMNGRMCLGSHSGRIHPGKKPSEPNVSQSGGDGERQRRQTCVHAIAAYGSVEVQNSAASHLERLEKAGGLAPQLVWTIREGKYSYPLQGIETRFLSCQPVTKYVDQLRPPSPRFAKKSLPRS